MIETEVCFRCWPVTQGLTLWPVGTIGREADPLVNTWSDSPLGTPLFTPSEIEHEAANTMTSPGPRPPSRSQYPPWDVLGSAREVIDGPGHPVVGSPLLADNDLLPIGVPSSDLNATSVSASEFFGEGTFWIPASKQKETSHGPG